MLFLNPALPESFSSCPINGLDFWEGIGLNGYVLQREPFMKTALFTVIFSRYFAYDYAGDATFSL
jgi:hypothetical protein